MRREEHVPGPLQMALSVLSSSLELHFDRSTLHGLAAM